MSDFTLTNPTVTAGLRPKSSTDNYETHDDDHGAGGYRSVQSIANLDTIPTERRKAYMEVAVRNVDGSPRPYWLASPDNDPTNLANNAFWIPIPFENWVTTASVGGYTYMGDFNASAGTITTGINLGTVLDDSPLTPTDSNNGDYYKCTTAGSFDFGSGSITFALDDRAIWNGTTWEKDEQQSASTDWNLITNMPQIISDIGDGTFVPVSQTDFNTLEVEVGVNTAKLLTLILGAGTDIAAINNTDIITKQMLTNNFFTKTEVTAIETSLQTNIDAILDDNASTVDQVIGSYTAYDGRLTDTYTSSLIEDKLLIVYNAAVADAPGGNVYASTGMVSGTLDGITLAIDLGVKSDKVLPPIVGNVVQTLTTGYAIDNTGTTTIITFAGTPSDYLNTDTKYEIHYLIGIGDASETDPIFVASTAYDITATNKSNWTEAYNNYIVGGELISTDLVLSLNGGGILPSIDLSSLAAGSGTTISGLSEYYLSKANTAGDNIGDSQLYDDGTDIGIFTEVLTGGGFNIIRDISTKPLVLINNVNIGGDALSIKLPESSTGKYLMGINGTTENFSINADAKITVNKLILNNPATLAIGSPKLLILNEITEEVVTYDGTLDLDFILSVGNTSITRSGHTLGWKLEELVSGGDTVVGASSLGTLKSYTLNGLSINTDVLTNSYTSLSSLLDTTISSIVDPNYLGWNGSAWINKNVDYSEIENTPISILAADRYQISGDFDTGTLLDIVNNGSSIGARALRLSTPNGANQGQAALEVNYGSATLHTYADGLLYINNGGFWVNNAKGIKVTNGSGAYDIIVEDNSTTPKGIEYLADYSANYVDRSLVDKAYVDSFGEVGSWTPTITTVTITPNSSICRYIKIGKNVHLSFSFTVPSTSDSNTFEIGGLPFTPSYISYGIVGTQDYSPVGAVTTNTLAISSGKLIVASTKSGAATMINSDFSLKVVFGSITYQVA